MVSVREPSPLQVVHRIAEGDETCTSVCLSEQSEISMIKHARYACRLCGPWSGHFSLMSA